MSVAASYTGGAAGGFAVAAVARADNKTAQVAIPIIRFMSIPPFGGTLELRRAETESPPFRKTRCNSNQNWYRIPTTTRRSLRNANRGAVWPSVFNSMNAFSFLSRILETDAL